jgi:hypothetical protein
MSVGKSPAELESMIMERLRDKPGCKALYRVVVAPEGREGGWTAQAEPKMGMTVLDDCTRAINSIVTDLRRDHHLEMGNRDGSSRS